VSAGQRAGRGIRRDLDAGTFQPMIDSFELYLLAGRKKPKTVRTYTEAAQWFAAAQLRPAGLASWQDVTAADVQRWIVALLGRGYSDCYASNQFRALQQFFKWHSSEDPDEPRPNPMAGLKPPSIDENVVPVITGDQLAALELACRQRGFQGRRDAAIISLFRATGIRLSEMAGLRVDDIDLRQREAKVTGKGGKQRVVKFGPDAALALDRYKRERVTHQRAFTPQLWLGISGRGPMTASGIYQMIERRGKLAGIAIHPHMFRHTFSHSWLDNGGAEGDLMELNGWTSPQMLRRYGRSAASARARRSYDRIMEAM